MDRPSTEEARIQELIRVGQQARDTAGKEILELKHKLDVPMRLKDSMRSKPAAWLVGSTAAGIATSLLLRRKSSRRKVSHKRTSTLLGLTLTAARPLVKIWLGSKLKQWAGAAISRNQQVTPITPFKPTPDTSRSHVSTQGPRPR